jgi:signal transduction histidine kinase
VTHLLDDGGVWHAVAHAHQPAALDCASIHVPPPEELHTRSLAGRSFLVCEEGASHLVAPLRARGQLLGLMVFARPHAFSLDDLSLSEELAHRAAMALESARLYQEAREAVRIRDRFLSIASHELKTPLTPLQLQVSSIARDARRGALDSGRVERKAELIQGQVRRLTALIDDLLDVSRISAGRLQMQRERVDLAAVVSDVVQRFRPALQRAGSPLDLELEAPTWGLWDGLRLEQVVTNLLSNAIKYGQGKPIDIRLQHTASGARLAVRDHGIGIAPEHQARVFERFERAVSERHYGGLGLGLWIVHQIVATLGGTVTLDSTIGEGSTFTVTLPSRLEGEVHHEAAPLH